jgi:hypothetical protein
VHPDPALLPKHHKLAAFYEGKQVHFHTENDFYNGTFKRKIETHARAPGGIACRGSSNLTPGGRLMLIRSIRGAPAAGGGLIFISNSAVPSGAVAMWLVMIQFSVIVSTQDRPNFARVRVL